MTRKYRGKTTLYGHEGMGGKEREMKKVILNEDAPMYVFIGWIKHISGIK